MLKVKVRLVNRYWRVKIKRKRKVRRVKRKRYRMCSNHLLLNLNPKIFKKVNKPNQSQPHQLYRMNGP